MITALKQTILSVSAAAIFSAVMLTLVKGSALHEIVRLATGMLMIIALLAPLSQISFPTLGHVMQQEQQSIQVQTAQQEETNKALSQRSFSSAISAYLAEELDKKGVHCAIETQMKEGADGTLEIDSIFVRAYHITDEQAQTIETLITQACGITQGQVQITEE